MKSTSGGSPVPFWIPLRTPKERRASLRPTLLRRTNGYSVMPIATTSTPCPASTTARRSSPPTTSASICGTSTSATRASVVSLVAFSLDILDIKPSNMSNLTEVISSACCHPNQCSLFAYSTSRGVTTFSDLRVASRSTPVRGCDAVAASCVVFQDESKVDPEIADLVSTISSVHFTRKREEGVQRSGRSLLFDSRLSDGEGVGQLHGARAGAGVFGPRESASAVRQDERQRYVFRPLRHRHQRRRSQLHHGVLSEHLPCSGGARVGRR